MSGLTSSRGAKRLPSSFVVHKGVGLSQKARIPHSCNLHRSRYNLKRRRYPIISAGPTPRNNRNQNDDENDPELSRRVFLAGILVTSTVTAAGAYRFVVGEDLESRIRLRISRRFPSLFSREQTAEDRRRPLNEAFARTYFEGVEQIAQDMRIITSAQLKQQEAAVQQQALPLFFDDQPAVRSFSDPSWLNFILYSRLHVISKLTTPASRNEFVDRLSRRTMSQLVTKPLRLSTEEARVNSEAWINRIGALMDELVGRGWISGYRIEEFDGGPGSLWQDERRSSLTLYAFDPVTMQAAQLIGEEQYEELSPKISGWIRAFLSDSGIKASFEDYYLDDAYRPDPEQFKPSQLATQFDLSL